MEIPPPSPPNCYDCMFLSLRKSKHLKLALIGIAPSQSPLGMVLLTGCVIGIKQLFYHIHQTTLLTSKNLLR